MNIRHINYTDLEVVHFYDQRFAKVRKRGRAVGKYLVVGYSDPSETKLAIFYGKTGLPIIPVTFITIEDAVNIASWLNDTFGEYFPIWERYPEADVFGWAKWSIKNGLQIYETIKALEPKTMTTEDVRKLWFESEEKVKEWTRS